MISARNHFHGIVKEVRRGAVNAIVKLETAGGNKVSSTISLEAVDELKLTEGKKACIFVKATEVMMSNENLRISARNQWKGVIKEMKEGVVNDIVKLEIEDGVIISSTISMEAVKDLNLKVGNTAVAIVKSTSVMLGEEE
ncbi:TOBE domain-containing protein [Oribacterium parvum]